MKTCSLRNILCIVLATLFLEAAPARAEDYTDIWWRAGGVESGWGVNLVQSQDTIFATFFVHGPAPSTTEYWYVATMNRSGNAFTGDLYQTTGTGIGAPWSPGDRTATRVGTATFTPTSSTTGTLVYNVGSIAVVKDIARQTLSSIALGGNYYGAGVVNFSGCGDPANNGQGVFDVDPAVSQSATQLQIVLLFGEETCTLEGVYAQEGTLFRVPTASYVCRSGGMTTINTTATLYEVKATSIGLEGRWHADNVGGCREDGSFSAVFP